MKTTRERELKLAVGPRFRLPSGLGERLKPRVLTNAYFDTSDHRLAMAGVTLRRRLEDGESRWQLKLPRGVARLELEVADEARPRRRRATGIPLHPPKQLVDLVTAYTRGAALVHVATLRTRRQTVTVRDAQRPAAEIALDAVEVMDGRRVVSRFRELEIELTGGDEGTLSRLEETLRAAGATDGDGRPKLLRALDIAQPEPTPAIEPDAPADHLRAMISEQGQLVIAHDPGTRLGHDPEDLHQMRVACRRLRALLRQAGPMLDPGWFEPLREEIGWLGDELGRVRDLDVLRQQLRDHVATLEPGDARSGARLIRALEVDRTRARDALLAALASDRYLKLLDALDEAARHPHVADADASLEALAADAFESLRKAARRLGDEPSDEALHDVRIKVKRARYAAELAAPVKGKPAERFITQAKKLQDLLGEHQDAVVAEQRIRDLGTRARSAGAALVAGRLMERQVVLRAERRCQFRKRWRKLEKRGIKAWR